MSLLAAAALAAGYPAGASVSAQVLPTEFEAVRIYAVPETTDGQRIKLLVDTGGGSGMYWITTAAAKRLHLETSICTVGEERLTLAQLPDYRPDRSLPPLYPGSAAHFRCVQGCTATTPPPPP